MPVDGGRRRESSSAGTGGVGGSGGAQQRLRWKVTRSTPGGRTVLAVHTDAEVIQMRQVVPARARQWGQQARGDVRVYCRAAHGGRAAARRQARGWLGVGDSIVFFIADGDTAVEVLAHPAAIAELVRDDDAGTVEVRCDGPHGPASAVLSVHRQRLDDVVAALVAVCDEAQPAQDEAAAASTPPPPAAPSSSSSARPPAECRELSPPRRRAGVGGRSASAAAADAAPSPFEASSGTNEGRWAAAAGEAARGLGAGEGFIRALRQAGEAVLLEAESLRRGGGDGDADATLLEELAQHIVFPPEDGGVDAAAAAASARLARVAAGVAAAGRSTHGTGECSAAEALLLRLLSQEGREVDRLVGLGWGGSGDDGRPRNEAPARALVAALAGAAEAAACGEGAAAPQGFAAAAACLMRLEARRLPEGLLLFHARRVDGAAAARLRLLLPGEWYGAAGPLSCTTERALAAASFTPEGRRTNVLLAVSGAQAVAAYPHGQHPLDMEHLLPPMSAFTVLGVSQTDTCVVLQLEHKGSVLAGGEPASPAATATPPDAGGFAGDGWTAAPATEAEAAAAATRHGGVGAERSVGQSRVRALSYGEEEEAEEGGDAAAAAVAEAAETSAAAALSVEEATAAEVDPVLQAERARIEALRAQAAAEMSAAEAARREAEAQRAEAARLRDEAAAEARRVQEAGEAAEAERERKEEAVAEAMRRVEQSERRRARALSLPPEGEEEEEEEVGVEDEEDGGGGGGGGDEGVRAALEAAQEEAARLRAQLDDGAAAEAERARVVEELRAQAAAEMSAAEAARREAEAQRAEAARLRDEATAAAAATVPAMPAEREDEDGVREREDSERRREQTLSPPDADTDKEELAAMQAALEVARREATGLRAQLEEQAAAAAAAQQRDEELQRRPLSSAAASSSSSSSPSRSESGGGRDSGSAALADALEEAARLRAEAATLREELAERERGDSSAAAAAASAAVAAASASVERLRARAAEDARAAAAARREAEAQRDAGAGGVVAAPAETPPPQAAAVVVVAPEDGDEGRSAAALTAGGHESLMFSVSAMSGLVFGGHPLQPQSADTATALTTSAVSDEAPSSASSAGCSTPSLTPPSPPPQAQLPQAPREAVVRAPVPALQPASPASPPPPPPAPGVVYDPNSEEDTIRQAAELLRSQATVIAQMEWRIKGMDKILRESDQAELMQKLVDLNGEVSALTAERDLLHAQTIAVQVAAMKESLLMTTSIADLDGIEVVELKRRLLASQRESRRLRSELEAGVAAEAGRVCREYASAEMVKELDAARREVSDNPEDLYAKSTDDLVDTISSLAFQNKLLSERVDVQDRDAGLAAKLAACEEQNKNLLLEIEQRDHLMVRDLRAAARVEAGLPPSPEVETDRRLSLRPGEPCGIVHDADDWRVVVDVARGSPAERAGLAAGCTIVAVDGVGGVGGSDDDLAAFRAACAERLYVSVRVSETVVAPHASACLTQLVRALSGAKLSLAASETVGCALSTSPELLGNQRAVDGAWEGLRSGCETLRQLYLLRDSLRRKTPAGGGGKAFATDAQSSLL